MAGRIAYLGNISPQGLVLDLDAGIKGSYPKTGSTWFDISNNGNNGTLVSGSVYNSGSYGNIVFNGTSSYVDTPYTTPIGTSDFSYNTWINFTSSQLSGIITKRIGAPTYEQFSLNIAGDSGANTSGSKIQFGDVQNLSTLRLGITSGSYNDGRWHNVTLTRTSTSTTLYIEGAPTLTVSSVAVNISSSSKLFVGVTGNNQTPVLGSNFSGSIANTQVYNQSLTQFQVWQNFNAYKSRYGIPDIVTDGLVLNLDAGNPYSYLSGSSGTTWTNTVAVSSSISGTLINGPVYSNGAITFDGVDDYVNLGTNNIFTSSSTFTVDMWFNTNNIVNEQALFGNSIPNTGWHLELYNSKPIMQIFPSSQYLGTSGTLSSNTWYNICITYNNRSINWYRNGSYNTSSLFSSDFTPTSNITLIAKLPYTGGWIFNGKIPSVKYYSRVLSQDEITQNFNALRGRYGI